MSESELIAMQAAVTAILGQLGSAGSDKPKDAHATLKKVANKFKSLGGEENLAIAVEIARLRGVRPDQA